MPNFYGGRVSRLASSQAQPYGLNPDFQMSPSGYPEFSPPINTPELGYNGLNVPPSTGWKVNSINGNNMVPEINIHDNINSLLSPSEIHHVDPGLKHRFYTNTPPGTKEKREKGCPDYEELPSKRDKPMLIDPEDLCDVPPTIVNSNYPFMETTRHPPIQNVVSPPIAGLLIGVEYVDEPDPLCNTDEVVNIILDVEEDQCRLECRNFPDVNQPIQYDHAQLEHNVAQHVIFKNIEQNLPSSHINIDLQHDVGHTMLQASDIEIVSEELGKMNV